MLSHSTYVYTVDVIIGIYIYIYIFPKQLVCKGSS